MSRDAWLARRAHGFGGSDVPALLLALGRRRGLDAPDYLEKRARHVAIRGDISGLETAPRIFAEKAGIVEPLRVGPAAHRGTEREGEVIARWRMLLTRGKYYSDHERLIVPASIEAAGPQRIMPLVDRHCPRLCVTPDAWCEDVAGGWGVAQVKCGYGERTELTWYHREQVQSEMAATDADFGLLVHADYYAREPGAPPGDGPIRSWLVERDERAIAEIRDAVREGWEVVRMLREAAELEAA